MSESAGMPTPSSEPASRPWLWPVIVAAIAVAAIVIGLLVTGGDDSDDAPVASAVPATSTLSSEPVTTDTEPVQPTSTSTASTTTTTGGDGDGATTACPEFTENLTLPLRLCDRGAAVKLMQENLTLAGFETSADGLFGPATEQSVIAFQTSVGLQADGIYGPDTSAAMDAALGSDGT